MRKAVKRYERVTGVKKIFIISKLPIINYPEETLYMTQVIKIDGVDYHIENVTVEIEAQIQSLQFVNEQILQRNNDLQVLDTARLSYVSALKQEIDKMR